jgi:serine/threonine-protein kinase
MDLIALEKKRWLEVGALSVEQSQEKKCPNCERVYGADLEYCPFDGGVLSSPSAGGAMPATSGYSVGQTVADKYTILSTPKVGQHCCVYKARDVHANRVVAFKVLHAEHKNDKNINTRFQNEGYLLSSLTHPHIISIHDFGITKEGTQFMALKWVEGMSLADLMKQDRKVDPKRISVAFAQVCDALSAVHQLMKIHGSLTPNHLLLTPAGSADIVTLIDFSRSQSLGIKQEDPPDLNFSDTARGILYVSPESMMGEPLDDRSDIYSLGCILYEALSGIAPFEGANGLDIRQKHLTKKPTAPSAVTPGVRINQYVDQVILKALEKSPDKRHQTIEKFARDFKAAMAS